MFFNKDVSMDIINAFPVPLGVNYFREVTSNELEALKSFEMTANGNASEGGNNTRSIDQYILEDERLSSIKDFLEASVKEYMDKTLCPAPEMSHYITQCWVNSNGIGEHHHFHDHMNSIMSGVYYVDVEEDKDSLTFIRGITDMPMMGHQLLPDIVTYTPYNCPELNMPVKNGMLIMFPSNTTHGVHPVEGRTKARISVAFNTYVRGLVSKGGASMNPIFI